MAGYSSRQSTYTTGDTINASDSNNEFDAIVTAFGTSGHTHDGTAGNGGGLSKLAGSNSITIGAATAGTDITVTFDGETNDGVLTWLEDEDMFKYSDDVMIADDEKLIFGTGSDWTIEYDEDGDDDLVLTGSDISIESATSAKPVLTLFNSNADANSATLKFKKDGSSPATDDVIGNIDFLSEDAGNAATTYGRIQSTIVDVTAGGEQGGIDFFVAENDGTLTKGLSILGASSDTDITVDISTHDGTAGGLKLGGTLVTATATELNLLDGVSTLNNVSLTGSTNNTIATVTGANALAGEDHLTFDGSDLKLLEDVNDGNPSISIGGADAEKGMIQAVFDSSAQTLNYLEISTATADGGGDAGKILFDVDGTDIVQIDDGGVTFTNGANWEVGVDSTTGTTAGKNLTVAAGSSATGANNVNGGNLTLSSGGGDGTGTSLIDFKTKAANTDAPASKMQLSGAGVLTLSAGGLVVPDDGNIGSASDTDSMAIDSSGNVSMSQNLTVTGNLTVNGTTTTLDTTTLAVVDPIIHLQTASDGGALGSDTNKDVGIAMQYHTGSAAKTAFLGIDDNDSYKLKFIPDASISSEVVSGSIGTINAVFEGDLTGDVTGNVSGSAATVTGAAQSNITSVGTLTTLTVDSIIINDTNIGHTSDTDAISIASDGVVTFSQVPVLPANTIETADIQDNAVTPAKIAGAVNAQTGTTYTLVIGDAFKTVTMSNASSNTLTIPPNSSVAFAVGDRIDVVMLGSGTTTITGGSGVTVNGVSTGSGAIAAQYASASCLKIATNTWLLIGNHGGVS